MVYIKGLFSTDHSTRIKMGGGLDGQMLALVCSATLPSICLYDKFNVLVSLKLNKIKA